MINKSPMIKYRLLINNSENAIDMAVNTIVVITSTENILLISEWLILSFKFISEVKKNEGILKLFFK